MLWNPFVFSPHIGAPEKKNNNAKNFPSDTITNSYFYCLCHASEPRDKETIIIIIIIRQRSSKNIRLHNLPFFSFFDFKGAALTIKQKLITTPKGKNYFRQKTVFIFVAIASRKFLQYPPNAFWMTHALTIFSFPHLDCTPPLTEDYKMPSSRQLHFAGSTDFKPLCSPRSRSFETTPTSSLLRILPTI